MAAYPKEESNGLKLIKMHYSTSRQVMYKLFKLGTPSKCDSENLLAYLDRLQPPSTANYVKANCNHNSFNRGQIQKICSNPSGDEFDITLLFQCIRLACENVAALKDPAWHTPGLEVENCAYQIKEERNAAMHMDLKISEREFLEAVIRLRHLLINTLNAAIQRYQNYARAQLAIEIQQIHSDLDCIMVEVLGENDLLRYCSMRLINDLANECREELQNKFREMRYINPVSFMMGTTLSVDVTLIFTDIEICSPGCHSDHVIPHQDIFVEAQGTSSQGCKKARVMLLEGLAGAGKTTLTTLLIQQWCDGGQGTISDLDTYQIVFHVLCRDPSTSSYELFLKRSLPLAFTKYRNLLEPLLAQCRILVVIDGLDEATTASRMLVNDLLHQLRATDATIICTSRPERSQDFHNMVTNSHLVLIYTRIMGIPKEKRVVFMKKCHHEIQLQTASGQDTDKLVDVMEEKVQSEHFRLPLNLTLGSWLYDQEPDLLDTTTTQTELYYHTHRLSLMKLQQRLIDHHDTNQLEQWIIQDKVEQWQMALGHEQLVALSCGQLALSAEAVGRLRSASMALGLPAEELLSACLSLKSVPGVQQYAAPHKGLQEYYGALYIVRTLQSQPGPNSIKSVLESTRASDQIELLRFQNLLQQVAGLLHLLLVPVPDVVAAEVVDLLHQAGIRHQEHWLDVIDDTKSNPTIAAAIACYFPLSRSQSFGLELALSRSISDSEDLDEREVTVHCADRKNDTEEENFDEEEEDQYLNDNELYVTDNRVRGYKVLLPSLPPTFLKLSISSDPTPLLPGLSRHTCRIEVKEEHIDKYAVLLPHLQPAKVSVDIRGDPACLAQLLPALANHKCTDLILFQHFMFPQQSTPVSDPILLQVMFRGGLRRFAGHLSVGVVERLPSTVVYLVLAVTTDHEAALLRHLHCLPRLKQCEIHVTSGVSPAALTPLPALRFCEIEEVDHAFLYLSELSEGQEAWAQEVAIALHPPMKYMKITFLRTRLDEAEWRLLVKGLGEKGVKVKHGIDVEDPTLTENQVIQLNMLTQSILGCTFIRSV